MQNKEVIFLNPGLIEYGKAWELQEKLLQSSAEIKVGNRSRPLQEQVAVPNYLLFCRHPHVFTLGKSGKESHLLAGEELLALKDAVYYKSNRGGDITYHGPGQLVGYPIFDLENFFTDIHKYMRYLEEVIISVCTDYRLNAGRVSGQTGVWIDGERKICAMGVRTSRWITMHGFAFNLNTDLSYFNLIVPCGISDKGVTSLQAELGGPVSERAAEEKVLHYFQQVFGVQLTEQQEIPAM